MAALVAGLWGSTVAGEHLPAFARLRWPMLLMGLAVLLVRRRWLIVWVVVVLLGLAGGASAWPIPSAPAGACGGIMTLRTDPRPAGAGVSAVVVVDGRRHEVMAHGPAAWRLGRRLAGESMRFEGLCTSLSGSRARFARVAHIVGRIVPETVSEEYSEGSMAARASNRVRRALERGVRSMPTDVRALFMGLVVGDDRGQSSSMIAEFRGSGLSHLCAASGQNVMYVLAVVSPLLRRRRAAVRWLLTLGTIGWFVMMTRSEPSVVRAGAMAAVVATNALVGTRLNARHVLSVTVAVLLLVDPMLAWNIGFALSVGATAGLAWGAATFTRMFSPARGGRFRRALARSTATTLAAQIGTMPVSFAVFGNVPVVSLVANPLAIAVAGAVMMFGLPVALVASLVPAIEPTLSLLLGIPVRWIAMVARVGSAVGPTGFANGAAWCMTAALVVSRARIVRRGTSP